MRYKSAIAAMALVMGGCAAVAAGAGLSGTLPTAATANPALWPAAKSPAALTDPATEAQIDAILC